jgi:hypothetical protein
VGVARGEDFQVLLHEPLDILTEPQLEAEKMEREKKKTKVND